MVWFFERSGERLQYEIRDRGSNCQLDNPAGPTTISKHRDKEVTAPETID
jgi:hypothetical protein